MAPGANILSAAIPTSDENKEVPTFVMLSGTSMACPHVAGAAALVKSAYPYWGPSILKSALMTTATIVDNLGNPITCSSGEKATPHDMGAGEVNPMRAITPGLAFETSAMDYRLFNFYYTCQKKGIGYFQGQPTEDFLSNMNYPSVSISNLKRHNGVKVVQRTLTNVGPVGSIYTAHVEAPRGLHVQVSPEILVFKNRGMRATCNITFCTKNVEKGYKYGHITWKDGIHSVRMVFAVKVI